MSAPLFDFDTPIDRTGTASLKWDRYLGRDILPLWVADMDFPSPPPVMTALRERIEHGVFGYTLTPAALTAAIVAMLAEEYGWQVAPEWLVWLPGLVCGLNVVCRAVGSAGSGVLTTTPAYPPFLDAPALSGRLLHTAPLVLANNRWQMDFDRLETAVTPETRLFLLASPHNPTGRVYTARELERLADFCDRHNLVLCSDEIHCGLILAPDRRHLPAATLAPEVARRTVTLMAPSKTFNLPGLGCAFAVIPDQDLRRRFRQVMAGIVPHVNALGYTAALAAYRHGAPWRDALLAYLRDNARLVGEAVAAMPGVTATPVEATYLAWLDCRATGLAEPAAFFEAAGVGLSDGREFGAPGFVRLNFGCPRATLTQALNRMHSALTANAAAG